MTLPRASFLSQYMRRFGQATFGTITLVIVVMLGVWGFGQVSAGMQADRAAYAATISDVAKVQTSLERMSDVQKETASSLEQTARVLDKVSTRLERMLDLMLSVPANPPAK